MKIIVNNTTPLLWRDIIHEAQTKCAISLMEELESYLVILLIRYTNQPKLASHIIATQLLEGLKLTAKMREMALQEVGDICLLFSGLFPGLAEKRLVKISYFINLGRDAYSSISKTTNDLYGLLSKHFVPAMDVLQSIRCYSKECPDLLPLQAYDLWNETGSQRALTVLKQYTKTAPTILRSNKT